MKTQFLACWVCKKNFWRFLLSCIVFSLSMGLTNAHATGEAVIANMIGRATARLPDGPVHEGKTRQVGLFEGSSIGETARVQTGRDGQLCVVLSPGAILCVAPGTILRFDRLRQTSRGLPRSEEDLVRQIHITLEQGRILLHAGPPTAVLDMRVVTEHGVVEANGGTFSVAERPDGSWAVFNEAEEQNVIPDGGEPLLLRGNASAILGRGEDGEAFARLDDSLIDSALREYEVCEIFFTDLSQFFMDPLRFDRSGLAQWIGGADASIDFLGGSVATLDVSPSFRPVPVGSVRPQSPTPGEPGAGGRWGHRRIWDWYEQIGPMKGFTYIPRYAVNSVEMWMEDTFDTDIIDEELGWAQSSGYTSVRVPLQYAVWADDPDGFMDRFEAFVELAGGHGLRVVPVLFDDLSLGGDMPVVGPQPDPIPDVHNSRWLPSPGLEAVENRELWASLEEYVTSVIRAYRRSDDVLFWDLYDVAGAIGEWETSLPLMDQTFLWARAVDPSQPLAVSAWTRFGSAKSTRKLERSDLITFQSYDTPEQVEALLVLLRRHDRPIVCVGWLMRQRGNDFDSMLPLFANHRIGWFNRGLVNGRTQLWLQQPDLRQPDDPELWQHDVFYEDGEPYRREEIEMIKAFTFGSE